MAELPIELWRSIFEHLEDLVDLYSCAQVCKVLYFEVKKYRVRGIAFTRRVYEWFHYATPISNHQHRVDFTMASLLKGSFFNLDYLKSLKIGRSSVIELNVINKFTHLEELDIDLMNYVNKKRNKRLSLAKLKVLYLFKSRESFVMLDTPQLAKVCTFSLQSVVFIYPESIRCLHTFCDYCKLSTFSNLEQLIFTDYYNQLGSLESYGSRTFKQTGIRTLKKLKEIDFYYDSLRFQYRVNNMKKFKPAIAYLLGMGLSDLKVFWHNVHVTGRNQLVNYGRMMEPSLVAFQMQHYEQLKEKLHFFWSYEFNKSMRMLTKAGFDLRSEEFTTKFLAKYSFRRIDVTSQVNESKLLLELIARSSDLFALNFANSGLDQSFFDQMANAIHVNAIPLRQLRLMGSSKKSLNFDFVSTLRHLDSFETDRRLLVEFILKLLGLPSLTYIGFASGEFEIERLSTNLFRLNEWSLTLGVLVKSLKISKKGSFESEASDIDDSLSYESYDMMDYV